MRNKITLAAAASLVLLAASCAPKGPKEYIVDDHTIVDIGTIKEADGPVEFVILYQNTTNDTIVARQTRTTCRCTTPIVNNKPIAPGEWQRIPITYDPAYRSGAIDGQVDIRYKDGVIRSFPFVGKVIPMKHPVTDHARYHLGRDFYAGNKLLSFGILDPGESKRVTLNVGNDTPRKMDVHFDLQGERPECVAMRRDLEMDKDGRDTLHVTFTMPESIASGDSVVLRLQPVVAGKPTEESIKVIAKAR